jgi:hypothetical protein
VKKNRKYYFLIMNILAPILIGAAVYYVISPNVIFVQQLDSLLGNGIHVNTVSSNLFAMRFVRNYLLDMMWGYALVFALYLFTGNNTAEIRKIFIIAVIFSAVMEILQLTSIAKGTFDVFDIIVEFLAEATAVFIIKKHYSEEEET